MIPKIHEHDKIQLARMVGMGMSPIGMAPMGGLIAKKVFDRVAPDLINAAPDAIKAVAPILVPPMRMLR
jgi:hypothetical protein